MRTIIKAGIDLAKMLVIFFKICNDYIANSLGLGHRKPKTENCRVFLLSGYAL